VRTSCVWLIALAGCNTVFSLEPTTQTYLDAQYFDAPVDAPFACPPLGAKPPRFANTLHQIPRNCAEYSASPSTGLATVLCQEISGYRIEEGPLEGPFAPSAGIDAAPGLSIAHPRLAPEGDELFVVQAPSGAATGAIVVYARETDGSWRHAYELALAFPLAPSARIGRVSRGPRRRMMLDTFDGFAYELEIDRTGATHEVARYDASKLGGGTYTEAAPNLSADGLRMVYDTYGATTPFFMGYADRSSIDLPFGPPFELETVPAVPDPVMTEDCSRIYFSAASSLLWIQQL